MGYLFTSVVVELNSELPRTNPASGSGTTTIYSQGRKEGVMDERTTTRPLYNIY